MSKLYSQERIEKVKYKEKDLKDLALNYNLKGSGIKEDPFIIEISEFFPKESQIIITHSNLFINIRNLEFRTLKLNKCDNLTFTNCKFNFLSIKNCAEISVNHSTLKSISISKSALNKIENSEIYWLKLENSFLNSIRSNSIKQFQKIHSPDNSIDIEELLEEKKDRGNRFPNYIHTIMISIIYTMIVFSSLYFSILLESLGFLSILIYFLLIGLGFFSIILFSQETISIRRIVRRYYTEKKLIIPNFKKTLVGYFLSICCIIAINIVFSIDLFYPELWINNQFRNTIFLIMIFLNAFLHFFSINFLIYSKWISQEEKNPFYPFFIPVISFLIPLLFVTGCGISLDILNNLYFIIIPINIMSLVFLVITSLITHFRYNKMVKQSKYKISISDNQYRIGFGITLAIIFISYLFLLSRIIEYNESYSIILIIFAISPLVMVIFSWTQRMISSSDQRITLGNLEQQKGRYEKAIEKYKEVLEDDPNNVIAWHNLGITYSSMEKFDEAIKSFQKSLEIKEDLRESLVSLGHVYIQAEKYDEALNTIKRALEVIHKPSVAIKMGDIIRQAFRKRIREDILWQNLAFLYTMKEDYANAIEACHRSIDINPNIKESCVMLGYIYNQKEEYEKAIEFSKRAVEIDPDFEDAFIVLGAAYYKLGNSDKAIKNFMIAIEINPKSAKAWCGLAREYLDLKQFDRALEACNISLEYEPELEDAQKLLKEITNLRTNNENSPDK